MMMEGDLILGGGNTMQLTDNGLLNCSLKTI